MSGAHRGMLRGATKLAVVQSLVPTALTLALAASLLTGGPACAVGETPAATRYKITLDRKFAPGQKYEYNAVDTLTIVKQRAGGAAHKSVEDMTLDATIHVLAVDQKGREKKVECTVRKCMLDEKSLAEPGSTFEISASAEGNEYKGKGAIDLPAFKRVVNFLFPLVKPSAPTEDELYGTPEQRAVGETWEGNLTRLAKELDAEKASVVARVKLDTIEKRDGIECMMIETDQTWKGNIKDGSHSGTYHDYSAYPLDANMMPLSDSSMVEVVTTSGPVRVMVRGVKRVTRSATPAASI